MRLNSPLHTCLLGLTRFAMSEEDFEISIKAYEWPRKMTDIMKEATMKVTGAGRGGREGGGMGVAWVGRRNWGKQWKDRIRTAR